MKLGAAWCLFSSTAACMPQLENEPAYTREQYLCEPSTAELWNTRVDECRAASLRDQSCGGVISLRGLVEGIDLLLDSDVIASPFSIVETSSGTTYLDRIDLIAAGTSFIFTLKLKSIGGEIEFTGVTPRELSWDSLASTYVTEVGMSDDRVRGDLRFESNKENRGRRALDETGHLRVSLQRSGELAGELDGAFEEPADRVQGCFHAFATSIQRSQGED